MHLPQIQRWILLITLTATASCTTVGHYQQLADSVPLEGPSTQIQLDAQTALGDLAIARNTLAQLHAGYNRYTPESVLSSKWAQLERRAAQGIGRGDLYLELSRLLAELRCDHTKAELPKELEEKRNTEAVYLPFRFVLFDRRMYIETAADQTGLRRGDEVLSIDGNDIDWWLDQVEPLIPVDGDATHVKPLVTAYSTEFAGPALDHFAPFFARIENTAKLTVRRNDKIEHHVLPRQSYSDYQQMIGEQRYSQNFKDSVRFERIGPGAAYLAVDTFINYRQPVDPVAHLAPYFDSMQKEGIENLVVDLRENGGGSTDAQQALLSYLITRPLRQVEAMHTRFNSISDEQRQYLSTWDAAALNPDPEWFEQINDSTYRLIKPELITNTAVVNPATNAFTGRIIVLTGPSNSSGSTHIIATLKAAGHVTLVGERTGGAPTGATAGTIFFLTLPGSGIRIRVPALRTVIANADNLPARNGIAPDEYAPLTVDAYFTGRDPALEAAKRLIETQ